MLLYRIININNAWKACQDRYQLLMPVVKKQQSYVLKNDELRWVNTIVTPALSAVTGRRYQVKSAIIFGQEPGNVQGIHVDGFRKDRQDASNWALNIPIAAVGNMQWFSGDFDLSEESTEQGLKYLQIKWQTGPKEIANTAIDQPTIVRIDIPHQVTNVSQSRRLILSVRFNPDIFAR